MKRILWMVLLAACGGGSRGDATATEPRHAEEQPQAVVPHPADDQAAIASAMNDEGVTLMFENKYADASSKFREAAARRPEAKYFFNLCASLFQEGKFAEALVACDGVDKLAPDAALATKAAGMRARINAEAKAQGISMSPDAPVDDSDRAPVPSGTQEAIATKLSEQGVALMYAKKYAEASAKFRDAVARVPEAKYFFNLCTSLFQEGRFSEALAACAGGKRNHPAPALSTKLDTMSQRIRAEARAQGITLEPN